MICDKNIKLQFYNENVLDVGSAILAFDIVPKIFFEIKFQTYRNQVDLCYPYGSQKFVSFCLWQFLSECPKLHLYIPFVRATDFDRSGFGKTFYWINLEKFENNMSHKALQLMIYESCNMTHVKLFYPSSFRSCQLSVNDLNENRICFSDRLR